MVNLTSMFQKKLPSEAMSAFSCNRVDGNLYWILTFLIWVCQGTVVTLVGQTSYKINNLNREQGLSESHIYAIDQDDKGFLWFGTRDGLNRYDGFEFKVYRFDPNDPYSLSDNYVYSLLFDQETGLLWVGTRGGLNCYDPVLGRFSRYQHDPNDPKSLSHDTVNAILKMGVGEAARFWIGTSEGLNLFDPSSGQFTRFTSDPNDPAALKSHDVFSLALSRDGQLWVGTSGQGLASTDAKAPGKFTHYTHDPQDETSITGNYLTRLMVDSRDNLWIGLSHGLDKMAVDRPGHFEHVVEDPLGDAGYFWTIGEDKTGGIWFGTTGAGLYRLDPQSGMRRHWRHRVNDSNSLGPAGISAFFIDANETMWIGSLGSGISHMVPSSFEYYPELTETEVLSTAVDREAGIWLGTNGKGVLHFNAKGSPAHYYQESPLGEGLSDDVVMSMVEDRDGKMWFGTRNGGLNRLDPATGKFTHYRSDPGLPEGLSSNRVNCLLTDPTGGLLIGTSQGLNYMSLDQPGKFIHYTQNPTDPQSLTDNGITCLYSDETLYPNTLWIGTWNGGLNRMAWDQPGKFSRVGYGNQAKSKIRASAIFCLFGATKEILWIGTASGLTRYNLNTGDVKTFNTNDGLQSNIIYRIMGDSQGRLWLSTPRGLSMYDPRENSFQNYNRFDGLIVEDFRIGSGFRMFDGQLYFGGAGGLIHFDPLRIMTDEQAPRVVLTNLELDHQTTVPNPQDPKALLNQTISETSAVRLTHRHRSLAISFATPHYIAPAKSRFAYTLDNFDQVWHYTDAHDRRAVYTNLDPGTYHFRVKAANKDGVWGEVTTLEIQVPAPPWLSWWAKLIYALALAGMVGFYLRYLYQKLQSQQDKLEHLRQVERLKDGFNRQLEGKVQERTRELEKARKKLMEAAHAAGMAEIATNVLHNLGNSLNNARTSVYMIQREAEETTALNLFTRVLTHLEGKSEELHACLDGTMSGPKTLVALGHIQDELAKMQDCIAGEGEKLHAALEEMVAVLRTQEKYVVAKDLLQTECHLEECLDEALELMSFQLEAAEIKKNYEPVRPVTMDRTKFTRIIFFLVKNALESFGETVISAKIEFSIRNYDEGAELTILDHGMGMPKEIKTRIFAQGFSTKPGHEGFGLHYAANAMKEMGGQITLTSAGTGKGTSVALYFPYPTASHQSVDGIRFEGETTSMAQP